MSVSEMRIDTTYVFPVDPLRSSENMSVCEMMCITHTSGRDAATLINTLLIIVLFGIVLASSYRKRNMLKTIEGYTQKIESRLDTHDTHLGSLQSKVDDSIYPRFESVETTAIELRKEISTVKTEQLGVNTELLKKIESLETELGRLQTKTVTPARLVTFIANAATTKVQSLPDNYKCMSLTYKLVPTKEDYTRIPQPPITELNPTYEVEVSKDKVFWYIVPAGQKIKLVSGCWKSKRESLDVTTALQGYFDE